MMSPHKKSIISTHDEELLWEKKSLSTETSVGLSQAVIFYLIKSFGLWQGKDLKQLRTQHVKFGEDELGAFVTVDVIGALGSGRVIKRYDDINNPRSVYKLLKSYSEQLANEGPFLVRPIYAIKHYICYSPGPLGVCLIDQTVENLAKESGLGKSYGNASVCLMAIDILQNFGAGTHCLATWMSRPFIKYKKSNLVDVFRECSSINCEEISNEACLVFSHLLDPPYPPESPRQLAEAKKKEAIAIHKKKLFAAQKSATFKSWLSNIERGQEKVENVACQEKAKVSSSKNVEKSVKDKCIHEDAVIVKSEIVDEQKSEKFDQISQHDKVKSKSFSKSLPEVPSTSSSSSSPSSIQEHVSMNMDTPSSKSVLTSEADKVIDTSSDSCGTSIALTNVLSLPNSSCSVTLDPNQSCENKISVVHDLGAEQIPSHPTITATDEMASVSSATVKRKSTNSDGGSCIKGKKLKSCVGYEENRHVTESWVGYEENSHVTESDSTSKSESMKDRDIKNIDSDNLDQDRNLQVLFSETSEVKAEIIDLNEMDYNGVSSNIVNNGEMDRTDKEGSFLSYENKTDNDLNTQVNSQLAPVGAQTHLDETSDVQLGSLQASDSKESILRKSGCSDSKASQVAVCLENSSSQSVSTVSSSSSSLQPSVSSLPPPDRKKDSIEILRKYLQGKGTLPEPFHKTLCTSLEPKQSFQQCVKDKKKVNIERDSEDSQEQNKKVHFFQSSSRNKSSLFECRRSTEESGECPEAELSPPNFSPQSSGECKVDTENAPDIVKFLEAAHVQVQNLLQASKCEYSDSVHKLLTAPGFSESKQPKSVCEGQGAYLKTSGPSLSSQSKLDRDQSCLSPSDMQENRLLNSSHKSLTVTDPDTNSDTSSDESTCVKSNSSLKFSCPLLRSALQGPKCSQPIHEAVTRLTSMGRLSDHQDNTSDEFKAPHSLWTQTELFRAEEECQDKSSSDDIVMSCETTSSHNCDSNKKTPVPSSDDTESTHTDMASSSHKLPQETLFQHSDQPPTVNVSQLSTSQVNSKQILLPFSSSYLLQSVRPDSNSNSGVYHYRSDHEERVAFQTLQVSSENNGTHAFTMADVPLDIPNFRQPQDWIGMTTSEINLGDYLPSGSMIPSQSLKLVTRQGAKGLEVALKFDYCTKLNNTTEVKSSETKD